MSIATIKGLEWGNDLAKIHTVLDKVNLLPFDTNLVWVDEEDVMRVGKYIVRLLGTPVPPGVKP